MILLVFKYLQNYIVITIKNALLSIAIFIGANKIGSNFIPVSCYILYILQRYNFYMFENSVLPLGSPVPSSLPDDMKKNFPNFEALDIIYGMTETMELASSPDPTSLGKLTAGKVLKIRDLKTD